MMAVTQFRELVRFMTALKMVRLLQNLHGYRPGGVIVQRSGGIPPGYCRGFARASGDKEIDSPEIYYVAAVTRTLLSAG